MLPRSVRVLDLMISQRPLPGFMILVSDQGATFKNAQARVIAIIMYTVGVLPVEDDDLCLDPEEAPRSIHSVSGAAMSEQGRHH